MSREVKRTTRERKHADRASVLVFVIVALAGIAVVFAALLLF